MTVRFTLSELATAVARGQFTTGDTVTIKLYRNASGTIEPLDDDSCTEQVGGVFVWLFSNITTLPTTYSDYWVVMSNGTPAQDIKASYPFGGWPDTVDANVGANQVTITVEETDTTAIADVEVQVLNSAQTLVLDTKTTDASGQVVFSLDDGSYKIRSAKNQVSFTVPETLTVSGTTVDTYNGTPLTVTPGSGAGECEVSIFANSQRPTVNLASLVGTAKIINLPAELTGVYYPGLQIAGAYDSLNGRVYWVLPRGATVQFKVDDLGITGSDAQKAIPDSASADYSDL